MKWYVAFAAILLAASGMVFGNDGTLDLSELHCDSELRGLVGSHIPEDVERELLKRRLVPEALNFQIQAVYFPLDAVDSSKNTAVVYCSGGLKYHTLQLYTHSADQWLMTDSTNQVIGEGQLGIAPMDIDCDGRNEIVLRSAEGAAALYAVQVVKIESGHLRIITPQGTGNYLVGRMVEFVDSPDGCTKSIELWLDGPVKYQPDRVKSYSFDRARDKFELVDEAKIESSTE